MPFPISTTGPLVSPHVGRSGWADLTDQPIVSAEALEWKGLRLTTARETDGDVVVPGVERDMLVMTLEGTRRHYARFDSREYLGPSRPGEVALLPRGVRLESQWQNEGELQTFHLVELTPELFHTYAPEIATERMLAGHLVPDGFADRPNLANLIRLLSREHDPEQRRGTLFAQTLIRLLAIEVAGVAWTWAPDNVNATPVGDRRVKRAIDFIEAYFSTDVSITDIASAAGISPSQLTTAFQRSLGQSPYAYVISRRLQRATELLRQTDLSIAHVALETGFCDQAHLTRLCRARLGKTPRQIRQG